MECDSLTVSLDTLIAVSPMLGHRLEDRARIRRDQDPALLRALQAASTIPLSNPAQQALFLVAPLDLLVTDEAAPTSEIEALRSAGLEVRLSPEGRQAIA